MRLDVFGRFQIDLTKLEGRWRVVRIGQGLGVPLEAAIPPELDEEQAIRYLEDLWHEQGGPGRRVRRVRAARP